MTNDPWRGPDRICHHCDVTTEYRRCPICKGPTETPEPDATPEGDGMCPVCGGWSPKAGTPCSAQCDPKARGETALRLLSIRQKIALELWHRWAPGHHDDWEEEPHKAEYLLAADAILAVLREPTAEMICAGEAVETRSKRLPHSTIIWVAMIDAALARTPSP